MVCWRVAPQWKDRKQSPRWAGLPSPQHDDSNPLSDMMEPEPEPPQDLREQLRQSREQLRQLEQVQAAADAVADGDDEEFESDLHLYEKQPEQAQVTNPVSPSPSVSSHAIRISLLVKHFDRSVCDVSRPRLGRWPRQHRAGRRMRRSKRSYGRIMSGYR